MEGVVLAGVTAAQEGGHTTYVIALRRGGGHGVSAASEDCGATAASDDDIVKVVHRYSAVRRFADAIKHRPNAPHLAGSAASIAAASVASAWLGLTSQAELIDKRVAAIDAFVRGLLSAMPHDQLVADFLQADGASVEVAPPKRASITSRRAEEVAQTLMSPPPPLEWEALYEEGGDDVDVDGESQPDDDEPASSEAAESAVAAPLSVRATRLFRSRSSSTDDSVSNPHDAAAASAGPMLGARVWLLPEGSCGSDGGAIVNDANWVEARVVGRRFAGGDAQLSVRHAGEDEWIDAHSERIRPFADVQQRTPSRQRSLSSGGDRPGSSTPAQPPLVDATETLRSDVEARDVRIAYLEDLLRKHGVAFEQPG